MARGPEGQLGCDHCFCYLKKGSFDLVQLSFGICRHRTATAGSPQLLGKVRALAVRCYWDVKIRIVSGSEKQQRAIIIAQRYYQCVVFSYLITLFAPHPINNKLFFMIFSICWKYRVTRGIRNSDNKIFKYKNIKTRNVLPMLIWLFFYFVTFSAFVI